LEGSAIDLEIVANTQFPPFFDFPSKLIPEMGFFHCGKAVFEAKLRVEAIGVRHGENFAETFMLFVRSGGVLPREIDALPIRTKFFERIGRCDQSGGAVLGMVGNRLDWR
jgi:hypothetical protein